MWKGNIDKLNIERSRTFFFAAYRTGSTTVLFYSHYFNLTDTPLSSSISQTLSASTTSQSSPPSTSSNNAPNGSATLPSGKPSNSVAIGAGVGGGIGGAILILGGVFLALRIQENKRKNSARYGVEGMPAGVQSYQIDSHYQSKPLMAVSTSDHSPAERVVAELDGRR